MLSRPAFGPLEPWQRNQYIIVLTVASAHLGFDFSQPFLPLYVRYLGVTDLGQAALWSGLLVGITPLCVAIMAPIWGALADHFGRKQMVLRAMWAIALMCLVQAAAPDVVWLFWARLVMGIFGGFTPMAMTLAISAGPRDRVGQAVGLIQAAQFLPLAIGPPLGGLISDHFGLRANWLLSGGMTALSAIMLIFLYREAPLQQPSVRTGHQDDAARGGLLRLLTLPGFLATLVVLFLAQSSDRSLIPILPLFLGQIETPASQLGAVTGLVISAGAVAAAVSSALLGRLARPGHTRPILIAALAGGALCVALLAYVQSWEQVLGLRLLLGLVAGGSVGLAYTLGARLAPPQRTGLALGVLSSCTTLGGAMAPFLAGVLGQVNLRVVFLADAGLYLAALALVILALRVADKASDRVRTPS